MDEQQLEEWGRRAYATSVWRNLPGMQFNCVCADGSRDLFRWPDAYGRDVSTKLAIKISRRAIENHDPYPLLADPATKGAIIFRLLPSLGYHLAISPPPLGPSGALGWHGPGGFHRHGNHLTRYLVEEIIVLALEHAHNNQPGEKKNV